MRQLILESCPFYFPKLYFRSAQIVSHHTAKVLSLHSMQTPSSLYVLHQTSDRFVFRAWCGMSLGRYSVPPSVRRNRSDVRVYPPRCPRSPGGERSPVPLIRPGLLFPSSRLVPILSMRSCPRLSPRCGRRAGVDPRSRCLGVALFAGVVVVTGRRTPRGPSCRGGTAEEIVQCVRVD